MAQPRLQPRETGSRPALSLFDSPAFDPKPRDTVPTVSITDEMRRSYLDYAMSVIVSRAIPDLRDGLKPAHRRILYAMLEGGYLWNRPYRKSARVVGDVIGRYHPHGDQAVYDTLVRMAQEFSMRIPLVDGQGNFGSLDGDLAAAMRYTEVRLAPAAEDMLADIDRNTVDFRDNYDGQDEEPTVLPARIPNLLVNGAEGIAVGMATRVPPHNLGEVINAALALIDNPDISLGELTDILPGPDFPTGGQVIGRNGIRAMYANGRGSLRMRAKSRIEQNAQGRAAIIVDEIPYQVNKATMVEEIARLAKDRVVEGIREIRDESDRDGLRVAIDLKNDATPEVVRNQLHRFSRMETVLGANLIALIGGRPERFDLKTYLGEFLRFREEVVVRRTRNDLEQARERAHLLCGLAIAVENLDEVVQTIRSSPNPSAAREALIAREWDAGAILPYLRLVDDPAQRSIATDADATGRIQLTELQARAILELRLQRLTALGRDEIRDELGTLGAQIEGFLALLASRKKILAIVAEELVRLRDTRADARRTELVEQDDEVEDEALIEPAEMIVTVTHGGYIKRTQVDEYRAQRRGGKGVAGMSTKDEDFVTRLFAANTHSSLLFFTTDGKVHRRKVWQLPQSSRTGRGKAMVNVLPIEAGITVSAMMTLDPDRETGWSALLATSCGRVRRNSLAAFANVRANGLIAMNLGEGSRLIDAVACQETDDVLLVTARGQAARFAVRNLRVFRSRNSMGVRGIRLDPGDELVAMTVLPGANPDRGASGDARTAPAPRRPLLFVDSAGFGKRTPEPAFSRRGRGGKGVRAMALKRGKASEARAIVAAFPVDDSDQIMLSTDAGQSIRCPVSGISSRSRTAGGVRLLRVGTDERVASVARIAEPPEDATPESPSAEETDMDNNGADLAGKDETPPEL